MTQYQSPGVYVVEEPSGAAPIAGVGTSTAGFVGVLPDSLDIPQKRVTDEQIGTGDGSGSTFELDNYPVLETPGTFEIRVAGTAESSATLKNDESDPVARVTFDTAPADHAVISGDYMVGTTESPVAAGEPILCTNFSEFKKSFGDFSTDGHQCKLAHGVYGFFNNGGTRCYVMRFENLDGLKAPTALEPFEAIDEIALVAAPGISDRKGDGDGMVHKNLLNHCTKTEDRFAILDSAETITVPLTKENIKPPDNNDYGAFYFPWIEVFNPPTKVVNPDSDGYIFVGPSGHLAGIYARVDTERGVHKAPANEVVRGIRSLRYPISRAVQDGLNPSGINCIRDLNGNITVWGARTLGGDANGEWKYINVRRLFLFLRESIDEGTQWVVFEPNEPGLWAKITRNVTAFLTTVWRAGALFGSTPQEAFYVKCDEETNPPEVRDLGQVVTEIGVAVVKPAEFVIFRISQWAGPGG
jgi:phage tail sheath protein FI